MTGIRVVIIGITIFFSSAIQAATITAASCSQSDVQAAINSASSGDTVILYATGCGPTDPPIPSGQIFTGHHTLSIKFPLRLEELPPAYFSPA